MYDVVVIGAGISGSVCAKILAENGKNVLLVDKAVPPRDKVCSGVQLRYMEKLIGEKIPGEVLCSNTLKKVHLTTPSGKILQGGMPLLNYWRRDFDHWLNTLASKAGAETRWGAPVTDLVPRSDSVSISIGSDIVEAKYVVGADGLSPYSFTRRRLIPENFSEKVTGASMNYYIKGETSVRRDTLYLYYRRELSDLMYNWLYFKDDVLVIGASSTENLGEFAEAFLETVKSGFDLKGVEAGRDGYSTHCMGGVILGRDRVLLVGDAAGLIDLYRGVGMDTAALSARLCASALIDTLSGKGKALINYHNRASRLVGMLERHTKLQEERYASDNALEDSFSFMNILKGSLVIAGANIWNRFCRPEELRLLPP